MWERKRKRSPSSSVFLSKSNVSSSRIWFEKCNPFRRNWLISIRIHSQRVKINVNKKKSSFIISELIENFDPFFLKCICRRSISWPLLKKSLPWSRSIMFRDSLWFSRTIGCFGCFGTCSSTRTTPPQSPHTPSSSTETTTSSSRSEEEEEVEQMSRSKRSDEILKFRLDHGLICRQVPVKVTNQLIRGEVVKKSHLLLLSLT